MNVCQNKSCETTILDSVRYCTKHKNKPKRSSKKKASKKRRPKGGSGSLSNLLDAQGRVRPGMGLSRLKRQDELAWHRRQHEQAVADQQERENGS